MPRQILPEERLHPAIRAFVGGWQSDIVDTVQSVVATNAVVVVGMGWNPFCKRARRTLQAAGVPHQYLEYGNYMSDWRRRNALKLWTGWPTFPMVFVRGQLVGGAQDLDKLVRSGELQRLLRDGPG